MKKFIAFFLASFFFLPSFALADSMPARLSGKILIQVEDKGEAFYVYPKNRSRYFLGRPADAFQLMRQLGLGITNADFARFEKNMPDRLLGLILIKVEDAGKAFYVNPSDKKPYFLGRPADAFQLMRQLGLGITNANLEQIPEDQESKQNRTKPALPPMNIPIGAGTSSNETTGDPNPTNEKSNTGTDEQTADSSKPAAASSTEENASLPLGAKACEFKADFFRKETISGFPAYSTTTMGIDFNWGANAPEGLNGLNDKFSARFTGNCVFEAGTYRFTTIYNDGAKATLDNLYLANRWNSTLNARTEIKELEIEAGMHQIKVEYYDHAGDAQISLDWEKIE